MKGLAGKVAVIVGASGGFGSGLVERFVAEGARVVVSARKPQALQELADRYGAVPLPCDITRSEDVKQLASSVLESCGALDIAVNCAGYEDACPIAELEPARVESMVAVQFTGALYFIQHMANAMQRGGSIITIGSLTATLAAEGYAPYAGAKAGINHVVRIAASEYGSQGVRINVVSPTLIETAMTAHIVNAPGVREAVIDETPLGRFGEIQDVVNAVAWLASDESAFVTGQNLLIDGGASTRRLPRPEDVARKQATEG